MNHSILLGCILLMQSSCIMGFLIAPSHVVTVAARSTNVFNKGGFWMMADDVPTPQQPPSMDDPRLSGLDRQNPDFSVVSGEKDPEEDEYPEEYEGAEDRYVPDYTLNPNNDAGKAQIRCAVLGGTGNGESVSELVSNIYDNELVCGCYSILKDEADNSEQLEEVSSAVLICEEHTVEEIVSCSNWILTNLVIIGEGYSEEFSSQLASALKEQDIECMTIKELPEFDDTALKISSTIEGYSL